MLVLLCRRGQWRKRIGEVPRHPLTSHVRCNWSIEPSGTLAKREAIVIGTRLSPSPETHLDHRTPPRLRSKALRRGMKEIKVKLTNMLLAAAAGLALSGVALAQNSETAATTSQGDSSQGTDSTSSQQMSHHHSRHSQRQQAPSSTGSMDNGMVGIGDQSGQTPMDNPNGGDASTPPR